jgi:hypothetical protein
LKDKFKKIYFGKIDEIINCKNIGDENNFVFLFIELYELIGYFKNSEIAILSKYEKKQFILFRFNKNFNKKIKNIGLIKMKKKNFYTNEFEVSKIKTDLLEDIEKINLFNFKISNNKFYVAIDTNFSNN